MRRLIKAGLIVAAIVSGLYVGLFFAVVPMVTETKALPKLLALNVYDFIYRPARAALPYRNVVRRYWVKYERYWCATNITCELYGDEAKGGGLFKVE